LFLFAGIWMHRISGIPILLEVNAPLYEERSANDGLRLHRLGRWAQRLIWNRVNHVLPVTGVLARTVAEYGVPPSRITVIPNGINPQRFAATADSDGAKAALGLPPRLVLGFTGFIRGWNAVHQLIDFVALHKTAFDLHVLVVGDGPARESLEGHARAQGLSGRLTITGIVERDSVAGFIGSFDIAVLPGVTAYSSPLKLFEYLQLGCAIVAPDSENIREILTDGQNALLFDPARAGALEEVLFQLCSDAALRARLGYCAEETILAKALTWSHNAERVVAIARTELARGCTAGGG
jgi:glycosyltransferase involved in cell wall biosynthesis